MITKWIECKQWKLPIVNSPSCISSGSDGSIYVSDWEGHCIHKFRSDGYVCRWGRYGSGDGEFIHPRGIAVGFDVVCDESVLKELMNVPEVAKFPPGVAPLCLAYAAEDRIYVADSENNRIQVFGAAERNIVPPFESAWSSTIDGTDIRFPYLVCADGRGQVWVLTYSDLSPTHYLHIFDSSGTPLRASQLGLYDEPTRYRCVVTKNGILAVVNTTNTSVRLFNADASINSTWSLSGGPQGIALDNKDGGVYIFMNGTDDCDHVVLYDLKGERKATWKHAPSLAITDICMAHISSELPSLWGLNYADKTLCRFILHKSINPIGPTKRRRIFLPFDT